jgi:hypothetical protein
MCQSGSCSGTFACTEAGIREAIAVGGGPQTFDCEGPTTVVMEAEIEIDNDVILDGEGNLTVDGNDGHRGLSVAEGVIAGLRGLTVRGTRASGGINNRGGLDLRNVIVTDNGCGAKSFVASGIINGGRMTIADSTVSNGRRNCLSAIWNGGSLTVTRSTIRDNGPGPGIEGSAGVFNMGDLTIEESAIIGNSLGLALCGNSSARVVNSTVSNSEEVAVLGVGSATLVASTIVGATAIAASSSSFIGTFIGAICPTDDDSRITLRSTTISGDCTTETASNGYNIESDGDTCGFDHPTDQVDVSAEDVKLGELADNGGPTMTHALLPGSVAIDVIPAEDCVDADGEPLTTDQRGFPRDTMCDVGSFEVQP